MSHGRLYQRRVKNAFDKKVRLCKFNEGDLVLKKMSHAVKDNRGKWAPNYEGPFVVKRAFFGGALILTHMDGEELPVPVNFDVVKRYYAYVATYPLVGGRCETRGMRVPRKEYARSRHQRLFEENVGKTGKDAIYELFSERFGSCIYARGRY